ncbi:MAG: acetyl-CoA decarbonylase/synthase complex subunit delta [Nitrospirota bacterium]
MIREEYQGKVSALNIGGGKRKKVVCGGHTSLPFLSTPYQRPLLALEVRDVILPDHNQYLKKIWAEENFLSRIKKAESYSPDLLCLRFISADPDLNIATEEQSAELLKKAKDVTDLPLIITGCGDDTKDEELLPLLSDVMKGENALLGVATEENYRILAVSCLANGHSLIAETPLDVNLAKQLNILIHNTGLPLEKIVMHHATAALGYGIEYCYSIIEKCRLAALGGDRMLSSVMLNFVGQESWKTREAHKSENLGINWEVITAIACLEAGTDIIVLDHPESLIRLRTSLRSLTNERIGSTNQ